MRNPDKVKDNNKKNHLTHREQRLSDMKNYYISNTDSIKLKQKEYRKNNKEAIYLRNRARRELLKCSNISQKDIIDLIDFYNSKCYYCTINVVRGINLHIDHVQPLSKGGKHNLENLVPACKTCNLKKGTKTKEEFLNSLEINPNV